MLRAPWRAGPKASGEPVLHDAAPVDLDDHSFLAALDGHVTVVDFWASWCRPCLLLHPMFERVAADRGSKMLRFARVNVEDSPGLATAFNVSTIPTLIVFDEHGHEIDRDIGLTSRRRLDHLVHQAAELAAATRERDVS